MSQKLISKMLSGKVVYSDKADRTDPEWENQGCSQCNKHDGKDLDPIRRSPYRPAAFEKPTSQGLTEDRTRSRARKVENFLHYGRQSQKSSVTV